MKGMVKWCHGMMVLLLLNSCGSDAIPKPKGYFRIDLAEPQYQLWTPDCPFSCEIPVHVVVKPREGEGMTCWNDLRFPSQRATVHLTYRTVGNDLAQLIGEAHEFKSKHESKAVKITNTRVLRDSARVYGNLFDVEGDVASPMVFYLTDSTDHFLYGALYFDTRPNADSLAPVTQRLREEMRHLATTLAWQ